MVYSKAQWISNSGVICVLNRATRFLYVHTVVSLSNSLVAISDIGVNRTDFVRGTHEEQGLAGIGGSLSGNGVFRKKETG